MPERSAGAGKGHLRIANVWTTEQYKHFVATGQRPESAPKANKYGATRVTKDGLKFDSRVEADRYGFLKTAAGVRWVDVHPVFTLPGGIRYRADFCVWSLDGPPLVEDVKGAKPGTDFWRIKQLFDASHPLSPLMVVRRRKGEWESITERGDWK